MRTHFKFTYKLARRLLVGVIGTTVLLIGIVLIVLPGPAFIVIPLGLGILGLEFAWARRWLKAVRKKMAGEAAGPGEPDQAAVGTDRRGH